MTYEATNLEDVKVITNSLDKSKIVPLHIDDGGVMKKIEKFDGIYNISKGQFCNIAVPNYRLIQHKDYVDNFATALERIGIKYKMMIKPQGNKLFVDVEFTEKKHTFKELCIGCTCPPRFPVCICGNEPKAKRINNKPILPSVGELENNSSSKSAKLRILEKIKK